MLLGQAAGLDYEGLREAVARGIPGLPPAPPGGLPDAEELGGRKHDEVEAEDREPIDPHVKYRITPLGEDLGRALLALRRWLDARPGGPPPADALVREAIGPLVCGWSGTIVHALAPEPLTLDGLDRAVRLLDREGVREHVEAMVRSGLAEAGAGVGEVHYALTDWGREAIAPLAAAACYERRHEEEHTLPPDVFDVEAAFQMALPLVRLAPWLRGSCRLGVQIPGGEPLLAGATAQVNLGVVVSSPLLDEEPETWVTGDPLGWCQTVIDPTADKLISGGDTELADALLAALHERLFGEGG